MKKLVCALLFVPALAVANDAPVYVGGQYNFIQADGYGVSADVGALSGVLGYLFDEHIGLEARVGVGISDDTINGVKLELNNYYGVYLRGRLPNETGFTPYVIVGYTKGEAEAKFMGDSEDDSESDFSYGIGVDYSFTKTSSVGLEYVMFLDKSGVEISGVNLGFTSRF